MAQQTNDTQNITKDSDTRANTTSKKGIEPRREGGPLGTRERSSHTSPFSIMQRFMDDVDRLFGGGFAGNRKLTAMDWNPRIDVFERNGELVMHADLPGVQQDDVKIKLTGDTITIYGERRHEHDHEDNGVYQCERSFGSFRRSWTLPEGIEPESVRASFENGVLEVTAPLPRSRGKEARDVPITPKQQSGDAH